jgi:protein-S-isoprenylcysteine O-methyltransferase Ste14
VYLDIRARDRIGAVVLIAWNSVALIGLAIKLVRALPGAGNFGPLVQCLLLGASAAFFVLQIYFLAVRPSSVARAAGAVPRLCALLGAHLPVVIALLPTGNSEELQLASALVAMIGTAGSLYALMHLGTAFSVFPQARRLVTTGPYQFIRHPLYLFGELSVFGIALGYVQPWALILVMLSFLAQIPRMIFEEEILAATFDDYSAYVARTSRLIPGLY